MTDLAAALAARAAIDAGDIGGAIEALRVLAESEPAAREPLAMMLTIACQFLEALELLDQAPATVTRALIQARAAEGLGDLQRARHFAAAAVAIAPADNDARIMLAELDSRLAMTGRGRGPVRDLDTTVPELTGHTLIRAGDLSGGMASLAADLAHLEGFPGAATLPTLGRQVPRWTGEPVDCLVVPLNEGFGDALMGARYLPAAAARVGRLLVVTYPELRGLLSAFETVPDTALARALADADAYVPGLLLAHALGASYEPAGAYLAARPLNFGAGLHVGLCWAGNPGAPNDGYRSASPADLEPLRVPGVTYWSLMQRDEDRPDWIRPAPVALSDYAATARVVAGLDLVITVDTSVAHLAGALGVPVWIALADRACWRWQTHPRRSAWYDSARLFRQAPGEGWRPVFEAMCALLAHHVCPWCVSVPALTPDECDQVLTAAESMTWSRGRLAGDAVDETHRACDQITLQPVPALAWLFERIATLAEETAAALGVPLRGELLEPPIVARYRPGDHFAWHVDDRCEGRRALSLTVQLSDPTAYAGGELEVMQPDGPRHVTGSPARGAATAFASTLLHTVMSVSAGERLALVAWIA